jgi:hypothetical protein
VLDDDTLTELRHDPQLGGCTDAGAGHRTN